jgi:hypothetical protein
MPVTYAAHARLAGFPLTPAVREVLFATNVRGHFAFAGAPVIRLDRDGHEACECTNRCNSAGLQFSAIALTLSWRITPSVMEYNAST